MAIAPTVMDMDMDMAIAPTVMDMDMDTARGLLMLRLRLTPTMVMDMDTDMAIAPTVMDTDMDMAIAPMVMGMVMDMAMATATTDKSSPSYLDTHQELSVKMDYVSLSSIPHQCCKFQCCQPSNIRYGKQEAMENQSVIITQIKI